MSAVVRLLPDVPPQLEGAALERLMLRRRLHALVERHEAIKANGHDTTSIRAEIARCVRAIEIIGQLLNVQFGGGKSSC
jgi:hypothetical protein